VVTYIGQAFRTGVQIYGGNGIRINRLSWAGPSFAGAMLDTTDLSALATGLATNAIELTSAVEVHVDSCHFQNGNDAIAILDGGCQGIYLRNSTVVGLNFAIQNIASSCTNATLTTKLASAITEGQTTITLSGTSNALGMNPLDANLPWIGVRMTEVTGDILGGYIVSASSMGTLISVAPGIASSNSTSIISNTVTGTIVMSEGAFESLPANTPIGFSYQALSGIQITVVNSEINTGLGCMALGLWNGVRVIGNDISRNFGPVSTGTDGIAQFGFSGVTDCSVVGNNIIPQGGAPDDSCFYLSYGNSYLISGNTLGAFPNVLDIVANTFDLQFSGNSVNTSMGTTDLFLDANTTEPKNIILYTSSAGTLTSVNPLNLKANLPTTNPGSGSGVLWNNGGVVHVA